MRRSRSKSSGGSAANKLLSDYFRSTFSLLGLEDFLTVSIVDSSSFSVHFFGCDGFDETTLADGEGLNEAKGGVIAVEVTGM